MKIGGLVILFLFFATPATAAKVHEFDVLHNSVFLYRPTGPDISSFRASWIVPSAPSVRNGQSVAIWSGLAPEDSKAVVLQPVLQWGKWANGGSYGWALACWVAKVDANSEVTSKYSKLSSVRAGDRVTAVIELISKKSGSYTYKCYFEGYPDTELSYEAPSRLNTAWLDYETHDLTVCEDHSAPVTFTDVRVMIDRKITTGWVKDTIKDPKKCGMKIETSKDGSVSIGVKPTRRDEPKVVSDGIRDGRMTEEEYARAKSLPLQESERRFSATGLLKCGVDEGSAQLIGDRRTLVTSARLFKDGCAIKNQPQACVFVYSTSGVKRSVPLSGELEWGSNCLSGEAKNWAILKLAHPLRDVEPYALPEEFDDPYPDTKIVSVSAFSANFRRLDHHGKTANPKSIEDCVAKYRYPGPDGFGSTLFLSDCSSDHRNSGGAVLRMLPRGIVLVGVTSGWDPSKQWTALHVTVAGKLLEHLKKSIETPRQALKLKALSSDDQILYDIPDNVAGALVLSTAVGFREGEVILHPSIQLINDAEVDLQVRVRTLDGQIENRMLRR